MLKIDESLLVVVDVQEKLFPRIHRKKDLLVRLQSLIRGVQLLDIPVLLTEQVPEKIGRTIPEIKDLLPEVEVFPKKSFSCVSEPGFLEQLKALARRQIVIAGIETHVCVYQTAAELSEKGYSVQVVTDAVSSRAEKDHRIGLERAKAAGAEWTGVETLLCELFRTAEHPRFRELIQLLKSSESKEES